MGDCADAMRNGEVCSWCGVLLVETGVESLCPSCWKTASPKDKRYFCEAIEPDDNIGPDGKSRKAGGERQ